MRDLRAVLAVVAAVACGLAAGRGADAQCMLANPSFEFAGSGGETFGGWHQFGPVGSTAGAVHGSVAARVSGPDTHTWDVSGYWQNLDAAPGERWAGSVCVSHSMARPLTGQSQAIVNIEWRDAGGALISYESHTAADASTPAGRFRVFTFQSQAAPAGTASTHLLLGVLQGPSDPTPDVIYDQATFNSLGPPTLEERQWLDFAGGRTITFSGRTWRVKGPGYYGPGPNLFSNSPGSVWADAEGRLHLTIKNLSGSWYSTEVALEEPLGYGDYTFTTRGRLDTLDPGVVLGMFIWEYGPCYDPANGWWNPYNEVDVEFSRWGVPGNPVAQFVAQPYGPPGTFSRFDATFSAGEVTSHAFRWMPGRVEYRSWRGGPGEEATSPRIHAWTYSGPQLPRPEAPRVHLNLWRFDAPPAGNQEVVFDAFTFVPACSAPPCGILAADPPVTREAGLAPPRPNPFGSSTTIRFAPAKGGRAEVAVYDLVGRRLRTLVRGFVPAGGQEVRWDGRDDAGQPVAPGVYLCRLRTGDRVETRRLIRVR